MKVFAFLALTGAFLVSTGLAGELTPFVLPWDDATPSVTNLSGWLEKPAGARGFVTARDGHLFAGEKRIRFFGINLAFGGNFPSHEAAEKVAGRLAKYGINCVRFHHMDTGTAPGGLLQKDRQTLDATALDRLDYFIAQLKQQGIYTNLNLHVGNPYPGIPSWENSTSYFKGVDNFYPPMIESQRRYARALLTHVNPYTKLAYTADPAVAFIEINNENGLMMEWNNGTLDYMPEPLAGEFTRQWNDWLQRRYGTAEKLAAAWDVATDSLGAEMLRNGDFADGAAAPWFLEKHEGAVVSEPAFASGPEGAGRALTFKIDQPGKEAWHVQFSQAGLKVAGGKSYTLSFWGRASTKRKISVGLSQAHAPWKALATREIQLTPAMQLFTLPLTPTESDEQARLSISNLGLTTGEFSFAAISLKSGGTYGLREGESLGRIPFLTKSQLGRRTLPVQQDWNRFLLETEMTYWPGMMRFLKDELHARSLVLGSATGFSPWLVQAQLEVVDAHAYWQHPHFPHRQWDMNDWEVKNLPMAGDPKGGTLAGLALRRVAGKPFIITEYNHASPNQYSAEAFLEICAVAGVQDWDAVFAFAYSHRLDQWDLQHFGSFFDIDQHPTKMATLPAALSLFYGEHLQVLPPRIAETTLEDAIESLRTKGGSWVDGRNYGLPAMDAFVRPIAMRLRAATRPATGAPLPILVPPEHPEFTWDATARRMLLRAPKSAGVVGALTAGETIALGAVTILPGETNLHWGTINATVLAGADFTSAQRVLITATGETSNTGLQWKDAARTSVGTQWGKAPSLIESVPAVVRLPLRPGWKAWALDARGQRREEVPLRVAGTAVELELLPAHKTVWWELGAP